MEKPKFIEKLKTKAKYGVATLALFSTLELSAQEKQSNISPTFYAPRGGQVTAHVIDGKDFTKYEDRKAVEPYLVTEVDGLLNLLLIGGGMYLGALQVGTEYIQMMRYSEIVNFTEKTLRNAGYIRLSELTDEMVKPGAKVYEIIDLDNHTRYGGKTIRLWFERWKELNQKFIFSDNIRIRIRNFKTEKEALDFESNMIKVITNDLGRGYRPFGEGIETPLNYQHNQFKEKFAPEIMKLLKNPEKTIRPKYIK